jgi:hypothetical protein
MTEAEELEYQRQIGVLNRRIEELRPRGFDDPAAEAEIGKLDKEAASLIRAHCDARLRPITAAVDAAIARAKELLGKAASRPLTMDDFVDCMDTPERTKRELEDLETKLAAKHGVTGDARTGLLELERLGKLDDTDPEVHDWQATYARHLDWLSEIYDGEIRTFEMALAELEKIEAELAARHDIANDVRQTLMARIKSGAIVEDELVADWHDAYASYLNFLRHQDAPGSPPGLYGECHSCKRHGRLKETIFSREHNRHRGAVCELGCGEPQDRFSTTSR